MRQKRILDAAEENPKASIEELAAMVPSATPELVERVFDQHEDPAAAHQSGTAASTQATTDGGASDSDSDQDSSSAETGEESPTLDELSEKQRGVVRAVAARPTATQKEIGEELGVTAATVSNRVNSIPGFDWEERASVAEEFVEQPATSGALSDGGAVTGDASEETGSADSAGSADATEPNDELTSMDEEPSQAEDDVAETISRLEERVANLESSRESESDGVFDDPELVHKVVHACIESEAVSEAEELEILRQLLE